MDLQVPVADLQKHKLFCATPMYGGACLGTFAKSSLDLQRVCMGYGIQVQFSFLFNESLITRARNYLADEFLSSDSTHLMFIDADIDFNPMDVIALLAMDKPIIGGPYPKKTIAWENVYDAARYNMVPPEDAGRLADFAGDFVFNVAPGTQEIRLDQPVEVLELGTGFLLIKREVFEAFAKAYPQYRYTPDHNRSAAFDGRKKIMQYFQAEIDPKSNRYLSEDYWFCQKAREIGQAVWMAPWMQLKHHGSYIYSGSIPAMASVINHRIAIGAKAPAIAMSDKREVVPDKPKNGKMTIKEFNLLPEEDKTKTLNALLDKAQLFEEHRDTVKNKVYEKLKGWVSTISALPFEEAFDDLVKECFPKQ